MLADQAPAYLVAHETIHVVDDAVVADEQRRARVEARNALADGQLNLLAEADGVRGQVSHGREGHDAVDELLLPLVVDRRLLRHAQHDVAAHRDARQVHLPDGGGPADDALVERLLRVLELPALHNVHKLNHVVHQVLQRRVEVALPALPLRHARRLVVQPVDGVAELVQPLDEAALVDEPRADVEHVLAVQREGARELGLRRALPVHRVRRVDRPELRLDDVVDRRHADPVRVQVPVQVVGRELRPEVAAVAVHQHDGPLGVGDGGAVGPDEHVLPVAEVAHQAADVPGVRLHLGRVRSSCSRHACERQQLVRPRYEGWCAR
ncbi:glutamate receptor ionotropic, kainate 2 isoform X1 [Babesia caballi]|uniref:Glutamate receptor ionotropic, kainate 2 isoform X1 n=1 Tax=Babesia caballi TaxID=5871 RepID=A0AAV4LST9_BABCB|nr:glutamate receptor ionotropic, kainate 2 isoform X1 [Babesia caballi]